MTIMDTSPLQPFGANWPGDNLPNTVQGGAQALGAALSGAATPGASVYLNQLIIEPIGVQVITQFATLNGMTYAQHGSYDPSVISNHPPAWYGPRTSTTTPMVVHEVKGQLFGFSVCFDLDYVPSSIQDRSAAYQTLNRRSVIRIALPKVFPQIVLESNKNYSGPVGTFPTAIEPDQRITLEGDFDSYFDAYVPIGSQDDVLTVLSPDFMQLLVNCSSKFDVEFYGNMLTLVTQQPIYTKAVMDEVAAVLKAQLDYMTTLMQTWNYMPHGQPFDTLNYAYFNGGVVKLGSLRLTPKAMLMVIMIGIILFAVLIMVINV